MTVQHEPVRALFPAYDLRRSGDSSEMPTLVGHFAVFNTWTEIRSVFEGHFIERFAPGAFTKTFRENRKRMRVLFQHGRDPNIGDKPLGPIDVLREDSTGAYYEVPLLDTAYNRELLPALETGLYGASFRFLPIKLDMNEHPARSQHNPDGLPEHTVQEARVSEFGPVTFPAYEAATAGVRSLTDELLFDDLVSDSRLAELVDFHNRTRPLRHVDEVERLSERVDLLEREHEGVSSEIRHALRRPHLDQALVFERAQRPVARPVVAYRSVEGSPSLGWTQQDQPPAAAEIRPRRAACRSWLLTTPNVPERLAPLPKPTVTTCNG